MFIARLTSTHLDLKHWHRSIISIWKEDLYYWQHQLFPICNCGFGIWLNFDAVLRYSRATMCGMVVFVPPLRPPPNHVIFHTRFFNKSLEEERLDRLTYCLEFSIWERLKSSRWPSHSCTIFEAYPNTNSLRFSEVLFFTFHSPG